MSGEITERISEKKTVKHFPKESQEIILKTFKEEILRFSCGKLPEISEGIRRGIPGEYLGGISVATSERLECRNAGKKSQGVRQ